MKTAMQELIEHIESNEIVYNKDLILKLKELLEKEKEQIIDFHVMLMKKGLEQEGNEIEWDYDELKKEAEQYYNQKFKQNK